MTGYDSGVKIITTLKFKCNESLDDYYFFVIYSARTENLKMHENKKETKLFIVIHKHYLTQSLLSVQRNLHCVL